jgi:hypothetical protein
MQSKQKMLNLPLELILQCLHFVRAKDLLKLRHVCTFLQSFIDDYVYSKKIIAYRSNLNFLIEILPEIVSNAKHISLSETFIILDDIHHWNTKHELVFDINSHFKPTLNKVIYHTHNYLRVRNGEVGYI